MLGKILVALIVAVCSCVYAQNDLMTMAMMSKFLGGGGGGAGAAAGGSVSGGFGGMDPLTTMALLKGGGGGGLSKPLSMMAMMSMLKPETPAAPAASAAVPAGGAAAAAAAAAMAGNTAPVMDPMTNTLMQMSLCKRSEAAGENRFCTPITCKLQSIARYRMPNFLQCKPLLGCCFADVKSMYFANMMKSM